MVIKNLPSFLFHCYTGRSPFTPGLHSCKSHTNLSQNSHSKECITCGFGDQQSHPIWCMAIPLVDIQVTGVYICTVHTAHIHFSIVYIHFYTAYLFVYNAIKM